LNGDQKGGQYSDFTYRPFTLEGNFAFAQGVHEMLLQSYSGVLEIFPAVPEQWKNISFKNLRAEGAFLISAQKANGVVEEIKIVSDKGGTAKLKLPFKTWIARDENGVISNETANGIMKISFKQGGSIVLKNAYE
jgi:alpha-L-fucosidase 2